MSRTLQLNCVFCSPVWFVATSAPEIVVIYGSVVMEFNKFSIVASTEFCSFADNVVDWAICVRGQDAENSVFFRTSSRDAAETGKQEIREFISRARSI
jgi:hypothetical protein